MTDAQGNPQIEDFDEDGVSLSNLSQGIGFAGGLNTANAASDRPDGSAPHAMSEFYSIMTTIYLLELFSSIYTFSVVEGGTTDCCKSNSVLELVVEHLQ